MFKFVLVFLLTVVFANAQSTENWVKLIGGEEKQIYFDKNSVLADSIEIKISVSQSHIPGLKIETIEKPIYRSVTEYIFNPKIMRYSIATITYFDSKGNFLNKFTYTNNSEIETYKYSYPIFENSLESQILNTIYYYYPELKKK